MSDHEEKPETEDSGEGVVRSHVDTGKPGSEFETREMPALKEGGSGDGDNDKDESVQGIVVDPANPGSNDETINTTKSETEARRKDNDKDSNGEAEEPAAEDAPDEFASVTHVATDPDKPGSNDDTRTFEKVDDESEDEGEAATKIAAKSDPFDDLETREVPALKDEWKRRAAEVSETMDAPQVVAVDDTWGGEGDASLAASVAAASGEVPLPTEEEPAEVAGPVIEKSRRAQREWAALRFEERLPFFNALRNELVAQRSDYAPSMATAIGRPMVETLTGEYLPVLEALRSLDELIPPLLVDRHTAGPPLTHDGLNSNVRMVPYGVVVIANGMQSPFAFPMVLAIDALATGNSVLISGAEQHPRINETMRKLFRRANFPEDLVQVIAGDSETMRLIVDARPDKLVFEGRNDVAEKLAVKCLNAGCEFHPVRKAKDMMVVLDNADLKRAVTAALTAAFATGGMRQGTLERIVIADGVYDEFRMLFIDAIRTMNSHHAQLASINDSYNPRRAQMLIEDAIAKGARATYPAGEQPGRWIHWKAVVIESLAPKARLSSERLDGPGCALYRSTEPADEAAGLLRLLPANNLTVMGTPGRELYARLEALPAARIAFNEPNLGGSATGGGVPVGIEMPRSTCGPQNMLRPKLVVESDDRGRRVGWFPYTDDKAYALMDAMEAIYGASAAKRFKAGLKLVINPTLRRLLRGEE